MKRTNQNRGEKGTSDSKDKIRSSDATRKFDDCRDKIRRKKIVIEKKMEERRGEEKA